MKRRDFLKSGLPATAAIHLGMDTLPRLQAVEAAPPRDGSYDLVVIGGTLPGCFAAWQAARRGWKVLLIERRTFLGTEITATLRPWLRRDGFDALPPALHDLLLPAEELDEVGVAFDPAEPAGHFGDEVPLFMGTIKKQLMRALRESGVQVLLGTGVWGALTDDRRTAVVGLALASKFGLHAVRCGRVVDARQDVPSPDEAPGRVAFSLELYGVQPSAKVATPVPPALGLVDDQVVLHLGKRKPGQRFLEFQFVPTGQDVEREARVRTELVCGHLLREDADFAKATIVQLAAETLPVAASGRQAAQPPYTNYVCLRPRATSRLSCQDVTDAYRSAGEQIGRISAEPGVEPTWIVGRGEEIPWDECRVTSRVDPSLAYAIQQLEFPVERYLPEGYRADVIIAGGGTAGAVAAMSSIQQGARTVTIEFMPELGGTSTIGRVTGYYAGHKDTRFHEFIEDEFNRQSRLVGRCARGVARMLYYRNQATQAGGKLLTDAIVCGVTKDGNKVTGVVVQQADRLYTVAGRVVVDASGDGDVAAFAGAAFAVGNQRMQCTQNYSQWDVNPGVAAWADSTTNRDYDILWSHLLSEWQRGYQLSHQHAHYYDFTALLTVRESRRIVGDCTITLRDVLLNHLPSDTICLATSDFDPHHFGDTVFTRVGCLLPHQVTATVAIPYRAILPRGIDNLLISAKAISQTHNALQFTRMSFDIMTLGYVTGHIAANAVKQGVSPREFNVSELQDELREWRILPEPSAVQANDGPSIDNHLRELARGEANGLLKVMLLDGESVLPALHQAFESARDGQQRLRLAKALAWFGNPDGNAAVLDEMKRMFADEQATGNLPREYFREDKATDYWTINQDVALLTLSGDPAVLPEILALAEALPLENPPVRQATAYNRGRIDLRLVPYYNRIVILCFAIERMPHRQAIPALHRFLDDPFIRNQITRAADQASDKIYGGILESRLAATLARCGDRRGFAILSEYLQDVHPMLAEYARQELQSLLHADHGVDYQAWKAVIERTKFPLSPQPSRREVMEI